MVRRYHHRETAEHPTCETGSLEFNPHNNMANQDAPNETTEYEVTCNNESVANVIGEPEEALAEAMHYAMKYQSNGITEIWKVIKKKVWSTEALTRDLYVRPLQTH